uniref:hypothetical protein n=1 Tax=Aliarcobacter sp. TaxID=2321116 RepID=UPI0040480DF7
MDAIEILKKACDETSQGIVANELGISKTSVNLLLKQSYPNPQNMYKKILKFYGNECEIVGADVGSNNLKDAVKLLKEMEL